MSSLTVLKVLGRARSGKARKIRQRTRRPAPRHRGAEQSGTPRSQLIGGAPAEAPPSPRPPRLGRDHRAASGGVSARGGGGAAIVRSAEPRGGGEGITEPAWTRGVTAGRCDSTAGGGSGFFPSRSRARQLGRTEQRCGWGAAERAAEDAGSPSPARPSSSSAAPLPLLPRPPSLLRPSGAARLQLTGLESRFRASDSRPPARPLPPPPPRPAPPAAAAAAAASFERGPGPAAATAVAS